MNNVKLVSGLLLLASLFITANAVDAGGFNFASGIKQNTIIELYTSQGCSSCPPAEVFLNTIKNNGDLWDGIIPLAFHVDYWDYIGWKDEYAAPSHTSRQQAYARSNRMSTIYTPGFFANGQEWRRGFFNKKLPASDRNSGILSVTIKNKSVHIKFEPFEPLDEPVKFNIALLGMGLVTEIQAGERNGHRTEHEFVVLASRLSHDISSTQGAYSWCTSLPQNNKHQPAKYALVVWVRKSNSPTPIQAAGSYLP